MGEPFILLITVLLVWVINVALKVNMVYKSLAYILNLDGDFLMMYMNFDEGSERAKRRCRGSLRRSDLKLLLV